MDHNKEKIHNQIDAYLRDEISEEEKILFEKSLQQDAELLKEFKIHQELFTQFDESSWINESFIPDNKELEEIETYYRSKEAENLKKTIKKAQANYKEKKSLLSRKMIISLLGAASVALFITLYVFNTGSSTQELYAEYSKWQDLPSLTNRGEDNNLSNAQSLFEEGKYQESYTLFKSFTDPKQEMPPSVLIYLGVSSLELSEYKEAISYFDQLINSDTVDQSKGYWYKVLVYLKKNDKNSAISVLEVITSDPNNYKYKNAIKLLDKLK